MSEEREKEVPQDPPLTLDLTACARVLEEQQRAREDAARAKREAEEAEQRLAEEQAHLAKVVEEREAEVRKLFGYAPAYPGIDEVFPVGSSAEDAGVIEIVEARVAKLPPPLRRALWDLAYLACKRDGFGGRERRVRLTDPLRGWDDVEFEVAAVRSVMEGDYFAPSYSRDYWTGESDNEPGGLSNQRVRRLATVGQMLSARVPSVTIVRLTEPEVEFPVEHLEVVESAKARERAARGAAR